MCFGQTMLGFSQFLMIIVNSHMWGDEWGQDDRPPPSDDGTEWG